MYLGGITGRVWTIATTTYGIGVSCVVLALVASWLVIRWSQIRSWVDDRFQNRKELRLKSILDEYIKKIASVQDRRKLYKELLKIVANLSGSNDISLLLKNPSTHKYVVKESVGGKPMSFQIKEFDRFIVWLSDFRKCITRAELVDCSDFADVKTSGLQYCVQFHAEAIIPLILGNNLIGLINIGSRTDGRDFENKLFEVFDIMSSQFAVAIHNASLYEGLLVQNTKLKELDNLKTQLLANVSHELRTPLNSIIGLSEVILEGADGPLNPEQHGHLSMIRGSGQRLLDTVSQLLDLSKLEANKLSLDVKRINLQKILEKEKTNFNSEDKVQLNIKIDDKTPNVYGDAKWLSRVFRNLLSNAVKFTPNGNIVIDCDRAGEMLKIGVHDTGIGIKKEDQEKIFSGFSQASEGPSREHEGTGIGLAISKKIVELHGGRIWLDSKLGTGSHFFFTLPLRPTGIPSVEIGPYKKLRS